MNQPTITGSTDSNGLFTAKNPFPYHSGHRLIRKSLYQQFKELHPPLFCYNENNELVKGVEGLEVKKGHRLEHTKGWSLITDSEYEFYENTNAKLQPCYIAVQPTEKAEIKIMKKLTQKVKTSLYENHIMMSKLCDLLNTTPNVIKEMASGNSNIRLMDSDVLEIISHHTKTPISELTEPQTYETPLPEAQSLEGVKTAEETVVMAAMEKLGLVIAGSEHSKQFLLGAEFGAKWQKDNAQLATDAGAGKESELREALQQATDFIQQWAQKPNEVELLKRCKSLLTAPSTHSSSEMVEGNKP